VASASAARSCSGSSVHAHRRAHVGGLDEDRPAQLGADLGDEGIVELAVAGSQPAAHRDAGGLGDDLGGGLVHVERRTEHAGAHVGHIGEFEQALDGAVLAPGAVQDGQDHHLLVGMTGDHGGEGGKVGAGGIEHVGEGLGALGHEREGGIGPQPTALGGDGHGDDVVTGGVDGLEDAGRRDP
jgi:hypothetical protein